MNLCQRIMSPSLATLRLQSTPLQGLAGKKGFEPLSVTSEATCLPVSDFPTYSNITRLALRPVIIAMRCHVGRGPRGADTNHSPSIFTFDSEALVLHCELRWYPCKLFDFSSSKSALRVCHDEPPFKRWLPLKDSNLEYPSSKPGALPIRRRGKMYGGPGTI